MCGPGCTYTVVHIPSVLTYLLGAGCLPPARPPPPTHPWPDPGPTPGRRPIDRWTCVRPSDSGGGGTYVLTCPRGPGGRVGGWLLRLPAAVVQSAGLGGLQLPT